MSNNKLGLLSMCRRAGKLKLGMDMVKSSCKNGEAVAVFVASDFSQKSLKEVKFTCNRENVPVYELGISMDDVLYGLGKKVGVLAVTDSGFARSCMKDLKQIEIDENEFYSNM
ncbi:MAG: ribosomal L7Ae/L30e/S12e/Gadd45 family protein [Ruminococcus sp.]|nr:ribosomal L7Ae/L30e/S12e/Gadd45 family protein [Ruminococcus sp.]